MPNADRYIAKNIQKGYAKNAVWEYENECRIIASLPKNEIAEPENIYLRLPLRTKIMVTKGPEFELNEYKKRYFDSLRSFTGNFHLIDIGDSRFTEKTNFSCNCCYDTSRCNLCGKCNFLVKCNNYHYQN